MNKSNMTSISIITIFLDIGNPIIASAITQISHIVLYFLRKNDAVIGNKITIISKYKNR